MRIAAVGSAFPPSFYDQETLLEALKEHWAERHHNLARLEALHRNVLVGGRHLALPIEEYSGIRTFGQANDAWIRVAQEVGGQAVLRALDGAGLGVDAVDALIFTTVTGVATPSIDARLVNRLGLPTRIKRMPIFGLGCVAGAAGVARAADYVRAFPDQVAVLLSVELCSLTLQRHDLSIPNLIASGLFGDGAAAVVVTGAERPRGPGLPGPEVVATRSVFYPGSEEVMGWQVSEGGFKIVLSGRGPGRDPPLPAPGRRRLPVRARAGARRRRPLDRPSRRPQGARGHAGGPRAAQGRARPDMARAARGRQPVVQLGADGPGRHPGAPARAGYLGPDARHGARVLQRAGPAAVVRL
jgi:hypothetical protein